jgi:hypothetical protein
MTLVDAPPRRRGRTARPPRSEPLAERLLVPAAVAITDPAAVGRAVGRRLLGGHVAIALTAVVAVAAVAAVERHRAPDPVAVLPPPVAAVAGPPTPRAARPADAAARPAPTPAPRFERLIERAALRYSVDPFLVEAIVRRESKFDPRARSHRGAAGLMGLMPVTARAFGVSDRFDPAQSIDAGTRYVRQLLIRFDGDVALVLAAYNAGPAEVVRAGGVPPYAETREYVRAVLADYERAAG